LTGDWLDIFGDNEYYPIVGNIRPTHPTDILFPKTARFIAGGTPMGFIKLTFK
jgi:hypothetical protein